MKFSEIVLLVALAVFAGVLFYGSLSMPYTDGIGFGAGFLPLNVSIATFVLALILLARSVISYLRSGAKLGNLVGEMVDSLPRVIAPVTAIALIFVALLLARFGSVLAPLAAVITLISAVFLNYSWVKSAILSAVTIAIIYAIFGLWLDIAIA